MSTAGNMIADLLAKEEGTILQRNLRKTEFTELKEQHRCFIAANKSCTTLRKTSTFNICTEKINCRRCQTSNGSRLPRKAVSMVYITTAYGD